MIIHHISIRTADIMKAIAFYELLGFQVRERFTTGYTLACWLEGLGGRIELIQIPEPNPATDSWHNEHYVGYYHISFDITEYAESLPVWLKELEEKFRQNSKDDCSLFSPLNILLSPQQQIIGDKVYEIAFITDTDNLPLEVVRCLSNS